MRVVLGGSGTTRNRNWLRGSTPIGGTTNRNHPGTGSGETWPEPPQEATGQGSKHPVLQEWTEAWVKHPTAGSFLAGDESAELGGVMDRLIREAERKHLTGISRTRWWQLERLGLVPRRRQILVNTVGWLESEIKAYIASRPVVGAPAAQDDAGGAA